MNDSEMPERWPALVPRRLLGEGDDYFHLRHFVRRNQHERIFSLVPRLVGAGRQGPEVVAAKAALASSLFKTGKAESGLQTLLSALRDQPPDPELVEVAKFVSAFFSHYDPLPPSRHPFASPPREIAVEIIDDYVVRGGFNQARAKALAAVYSTREGLCRTKFWRDSLPSEAVARFLGELQRQIAASTPPPETIPPFLEVRFRMGGEVPVVDRYLDDSLVRPGQGGHRVSIGLERLFYRAETVHRLVADVKFGRTYGYGETDDWLYDALSEHDVADQEVVVFGSTYPTYEAIVIAFEGRPLTVEYQPRLSDDARLTFLTPGEFSGLDRRPRFAVSISSFEHDGLGRYGDPVDPDADLRTMRTIKKLLAPGAILFLSVPIGMDMLAWNANRIYGPLRLPKLLADWRVVKVHGPPAGLFPSLNPIQVDGERWESLFSAEVPDFRPEWVFVLRND